MKRQLSSLDIHYLVEELKELIDGKIDQIYMHSNDELILQIHIPSKGKKILKIIKGRMVHFVNEKREYGAPSGFCMQLRKYLSNARLRSVSQKESERIIEFEFEKKEGKKKLYIELFSKGNIVLVHENNIIVNAIERIEFKDRTVKSGEGYIYPKKEVNFLDLKIEGLSNVINSSDKDSIVTCLAIEVGLGGVYAEEVCLLSGIDKKLDPKEVKDKSISAILKSINSITNQKISPRVVFEGGKVIDIVPFPLKTYEGLEQKEAASFSEALNDNLPKEAVKENPYDTQINKIKRVIETQTSQIKDLEEKEEENRKKGEAAYENYQIIDDVIKQINSASKEHSWDEIKKKIKGHKLIKEIDSKEKKVVIELE